jgi:hypothetical protein
MNTTLLRSTLAAATAGALVLGSAAGAVAAPGKGKGPKTPKPSLTVVNIKGHAPLNVFDIVDDANGVSLRDLKLRATVRDKAKTSVDPAQDTVTITLDAYSKKVSGTELDGFDPITVTLARKNTKSKVNKRYQATHVFTTDEAAALAAVQAANPKAYLCISDADAVGYDAESQSKQTRKRLGKRGKAVRDCVKIINVDPTTTKTTKDDGITTS